MSNLLICDSDVVGWEWTVFQELKKLMNAYCDRQSVDFNSIAFLFDGRRLWAEQTPDEVCVFFLCSWIPFQLTSHIFIFLVWWSEFLFVAVGNGGRGWDWCHASPYRRLCCLKDVIHPCLCIISRELVNWEARYSIRYIFYYLPLYTKLLSVDFRGIVLPLSIWLWMDCYISASFVLSCHCECDIISTLKCVLDV